MKVIDGVGNKGEFRPSINNRGRLYEWWLKMENQPATAGNENGRFMMSDWLRREGLRPE